MILGKRNNTSTAVFLSILWFAFLGASFISGYFNVNFYGNLDRTSKPLLITLGLVIEAAELYTVIRANTYKALYQKVSTGHIFSKMLMYYLFYIMFAVMSIIASLGYTLTVTNKVEQSQAVVRQTLESEKKQVDDAQAAYDALKVSTAKGGALYDEWKRLDEIDTDAQNARRIASASGDRAELDRQSLIIKNNQYSLSQAKTDYNNGLRDLSAAEKRLAAMKSQFGESWEIDTKITAANQEELKNSGSDKMFILIAQTFHIESYVRQLKFFILMLASFLIELIIYQTSPDVQIDRTLLKYFRKDIPKEMNLDKLISSFEKDSDRFMRISIPASADRQSAKEIARLQAELDGEKALNTQLSDSNKTLSERAEQLAGAPDEAQAKIESLSASLEQANASLESETKKAAERISALESESAAEKAEADRLRQELDDAAQKAKESEESAAGHEKQAKESSDALGRATDELAAEKKARSESEARLEKAVRDADEKAREYNAAVSGLKESLAKAEAKAAAQEHTVKRSVPEKQEKAAPESAAEKTAPAPSKTNRFIGYAFGAADGAEKDTHYRLGFTTESVKAKFENFLSALYLNVAPNDSGVFELNDVSDTAAKCNLSDSKRDVFVTRLTEVKKDGIAMADKDENGRLYGNYNYETVKDYMTEVLG